MNVNKVNKYTSTVETTTKRLNRFYQPHGLHTTFDSGKLIPIYVKEVLPNDVRKLKWSAVTRLLTPKFPTMDNAKLDTFFFYVRNRDIWEHWQEFMGYSPTQWTPRNTYSIPKLSIGYAAYTGLTDRQVGDLADYMGIPVKKYNGDISKVKVNALPFRAVCKIWNDYFRDENYQDELYYPLDETEVSYSKWTESSILTNSVCNGSVCPPVNRYKDYFSSCLPSPQKGQAVELPLGDYAPLKDVSSSPSFAASGDIPAFNLYDATNANYVKKVLVGTKSSASSRIVNVAVGVENAGLTDQTVNSVKLPYVADLSTATAASVNALRLAFQTQRFLELSARGGTRYTELLQSMFGVNAPDLMLNRAEFLGGKSFPLSLTPVTNTANDLGAVGGMSNTVSGDYAFKKHFTEHGYIIGFCCVRTDRSYSQGIERHWFRNDREDFYFPVFSHIGEQPVYNRQIYATSGIIDNSVFGYQEAWAEYRTSFSQCSGYMRSGIEKSLNAWTYTDDYTSTPVLNSAWLTYQKEIIDRTITNPNEHQFIADFYFDDVLYSVVSKNSAPGLIDHY